MASVKESNTSKTAHVMNLLSRSRGASPSPQVDGSAAAPPPAPAPSAQQTPPIIASMASDMEVSSKIKDALEASLSEAETAPEKTEEPPHPEEPAPPVVEEAPLQDAAPHAEEARQDGEEQEDTPQEPQPDRALPPEADGPAAETPAGSPDFSVQTVPAPTLPVPEAQAGQELLHVNIMELLVEDQIDRYIKMFGLCPCPRCRYDAAAIALNHLPPQYVVMEKRELSPRLTIYESRFHTATTAQILRACKEVMDHPRHESGDM